VKLAHKISNSHKWIVDVDLKPYLGAIPYGKLKALNGFDFLGYTIKEAYSYKHGKIMRIKFPRSKSEKNMRCKIKDAIKSEYPGTDLREIIAVLNRKLSDWANYFKIGNSYKQALRLSCYVCSQLRLYWRRCKHRKDINGYSKWKNSYFYGKGLHYAPSLLSR
jgi:hypothetical protein